MVVGSVTDPRAPNPDPKKSAFRNSGMRRRLKNRICKTSHSIQQPNFTLCTVQRAVRDMYAGHRRLRNIARGCVLCGTTPHVVECTLT